VGSPSAPHPRAQCLTTPSESDIGGTFQYRSYQNAELVSSKQLTTFSDHRFPLSAPDHISLPEYVDYLRSYADRFNLWPHIKLASPVTNIKPLPATQGDHQWKHRLQYRTQHGDAEEHIFDCSHVAICTGLHVEPNIPTIPGIQHVKGDVFHSSQYKRRDQLAGRDVLIMGCGETAMGTTT
jgi:dimethylaniline monooxygenase (N-oxide forming)